MLHSFNDVKFTGMEIDFEDMTCQGIFVDLRIDSNTIPEGKYMYQLKHGSDDDMTPCALSNQVIVNFFGTFITDTPIIVEKNLTILDWGFTD